MALLVGQEGLSLMSDRQPDISLAKKKLNWEPKVGLDKGLKTTIKYFEEHPHRRQAGGSRS